MTFPLIIEDGSGVDGANSYTSILNAKNYAQSRGITLDEDPLVIGQQLVRAFDFIETYECKFQGERVYPATAWPRDGVCLGKYNFPSDQIPTQLKTAQIELVIAQERGVDLFAVISAQDYVTEETVGPITTKYANPLALSAYPNIPAANSALTPLFGDCFRGGSALKTCRG